MSANERFTTDESPDQERTTGRGDGFGLDASVARDDGLERERNSAHERSFEREGSVAVMDSGEVEDLRERWIAIQSAFIDEPRRSVAEADRLVGDVTERIARSFEDERTRLEEIWESGEDITTEDLRLTLQRYRAFFDRLLTI
jgi:hypothetical protein